MAHPSPRLFLKAGFFFALLLAVAPPSARAAKLALVGRFPEGRGEAVQVANLALSELAASEPGSERPSLEVVDDHGNTAGAQAAAARICADPEVWGVVAVGESAVCAEALGLYARAGLAVLAASSYASPRPLSATAWWLCPSREAMAGLGGAALAHMRNLKIRQAATVSDGSDASRAEARAFAQAFRRGGGKVVYEGEWQGSARGLTRTVLDLRANWPQVVYHAGGPDGSARLALALDGLHWKDRPQLVGSPDLMEEVFLLQAKASAKHSIAFFPIRDWNRRLAKGLSPAARKAYAGYGSPGRFEPLIFDAARRGLQAMALGEGRAGVLKSLRQDPSFSGMQGNVAWGEDRSLEEPRVAVFVSWNRVNSKRMKYLFMAYGPPWN